MFFSVHGAAAEPHSSHHRVSIVLENPLEVTAFQFDLVFDIDVLFLTEIVRPARVGSTFAFSSTETPEGGIRLLAASTEKTIQPGKGPIVDFYFDLLPGVAEGSYPLTLAHAIVPDSCLRCPTEIVSGVFLISSNIGLSLTFCDFDSMVVNDSSFCTVTISNEGTADLIVVKIISDTSDLVLSTPPLPYVVAPGESLNVIVIFIPSETGLIQEKVTIKMNKTYDLNLTAFGRGIPPPIFHFPYFCGGIGEDIELTLELRKVFPFIPLTLSFNMN
ncbi:MAG: hypothetical protein ACE5OR_00855 [bacterium]